MLKCSRTLEIIEDTQRSCPWSRLGIRDQRRPEERRTNSRIDDYRNRGPLLFPVSSPMETSASAATAAVTVRRGIPAASFVENVEIYLKQSGLDVNSSLGFLQERYFLFEPLRAFFPLLFSSDD